jgi:hypothetical protein
MPDYLLSVKPIFLRMQKSINKILAIALLILLIQPTGNCQVWRFAVVGDIHVGSSDTIVEMIPYRLTDSIDCILIPGDIVEGGLAAIGAELKSQLTHWQSIMHPLYDAGIGVYPVYGNHEDDVHNNQTAWDSVFSSDYALSQNEPTNEKNLTYSFTYKNALFIGFHSYYSTKVVYSNRLSDLNSLSLSVLFLIQPFFCVL